MRHHRWLTAITYWRDVTCSENFALSTVVINEKAHHTITHFAPARTILKACLYYICMPAKQEKSQKNVQYHFGLTHTTALKSKSS